MNNLHKHLVDKLLGKVSITDLAIETGHRVDETGMCYCPFHYPLDDKTLFIEESKGLFSCSRCGFKGTSIGWMMYTQGIDFVESITELCQIYRMPYHENIQDEEIQSTYNKRNSVIDNQIRHYAGALAEHDDATDYLKNERGLSQKIIDYFALGWCDSQRLDGSKLNRSLWRYGVLGRRYDGTYFPRFGNRILFPIRDIDGACVGFGARGIEKDDKGPKYINSKSSHYFQKRNLLYGLYECLQHSPSPARIIIVEGYMDVIALYQNGFEYAVAPLGTAISSTQILHLFWHTNHVSICLDQDSSGQLGVYKTLCSAMKVIGDEQKIDVIAMPSGDDPDSFLKTHGSDGFNTLIQNATDSCAWIAQYAIEDALKRRKSARISDNKQHQQADDHEMDIAAKCRAVKTIREIAQDNETDLRHALLQEASRIAGTQITMRSS